MTTYTIKRNNFSQLNDKGFYFPSGIFSLPFRYKYLEEINNYKNKKGQRIEKYFWKEKPRLLELENSCLKKTKGYVFGIIFYYKNVKLFPSIPKPST